MPPILLKSSDYRLILREEFDQRMRRRPNYSLRAFARDLELSASLLSDILNKLANMSPTRARAVAQKLGFDADREAWFADLVTAQAARSKLQRQAAKERLAKRERRSQFSKQDLDHHEFLIDWRHAALYALIDTRDFSDDPAFIAKRLGVDEKTAAELWERLMRLGVVEKVADRWKIREDVLSFDSEVPSAAIQNSHRKLLEKAAASLGRQAPAQREFGATTFSIAYRDLPRAKAMLREFQQHFVQELSLHSAEPEADDVYCLSLQFFSLLESGPSEGDLR